MHALQCPTGKGEGIAIEYSDFYYIKSYICLEIFQCSKLCTYQYYAPLPPTWVMPVGELVGIWILQSSNAPPIGHTSWSNLNLRPTQKFRKRWRIWPSVLLIIAHASGLEPGRVNQITFCPGQVGLTCFIRYPGLTRILHCIMCVNDGVWPCNDGSVFPSSFCSRCCESGHWWRLASYMLKKKKDTKGSRAWQQFRNVLVSWRLTRILFNPVKTE